MADEQKEKKEQEVSRDSEEKSMDPRMRALAITTVKELKDNAALTKQYKKWLKGDF